MNGPSTVYEAAGGEETFTRLIERFYAGVAEDPVLRPLYPADPEMFAAAGEHLVGNPDIKMLQPVPAGDPDKGQLRA